VREGTSIILAYILRPVNARDNSVLAQFGFLVISLLRLGGVILSAAAFQAERRISRYDAVCHGISLGPPVKARALRDDALWAVMKFKLIHYR
jgi:hypothetical protein